MLLSVPVLVVVTLLYLIDKSCTEDTYLAITPESCTCPGDELIFECTIEGDAGTYWQGTALVECLQRRILIRHSQFHGSGHTDRNSCGATGTVVIRTISAINNTFTTQLNIVANHHLNGSTVECVSDRGRMIGRSQIRLKSAPRVSLLNFTLDTVKQQRLTFMWTNASESCPATNYKIISRNCGDCPRIVNSSFVTCSNLFTTQVTSTCVFTVQSVVCGNLFGEAADPIAVLMNSPPPPQITHIEVLHNRNLHTFFTTTGSHRQCLIDQNTVISYTIKYFDPQTNITCGLNTIPASSCTDQICNSIWDLGAICLNSTSILVTLLATSEYGDVRESEPFMVVLQYKGNANHVHQTLGNNTSKFTIIAIGSTLGGIVILILILPLIVLTCCRFQYRRFKIKTNVSAQNTSRSDTDYDEETTKKVEAKHDNNISSIIEEPVIIKENIAYGQFGSIKL